MPTSVCTYLQKKKITPPLYIIVDNVIHNEEQASICAHWESRLISGHNEIVRNRHQAYRVCGWVARHFRDALINNLPSY